MKYSPFKLLNNKFIIVSAFLIILPALSNISCANQLDSGSEHEKIALMGEYLKGIEQFVNEKKIKKAPALKPVVNKAVVNKKVLNKATPLKNATAIKKPLAKNALVDKKKIKKKTNKKKIRFCLGGSYEALAKRAKKYDKFIAKYSAKYEVSAPLIKAVITAESCFNSKAVSPKGAQGLMQLMPPTAKRFGISDSFDPESNIKGGTKYLQFLMKYFDEDVLHAIAAYNAGEGAVNKYKGIPPYKETKNYVVKVAALYKLYSQGKGDLTKAAVVNTSPRLAKTIFVPRAMPSSRFSPYKDRRKNIEHGNCANRTSTRLRKSTVVEGGKGIWQRIYRVQRGDTLMRVMQRTGVHKSKIAKMNGLRSRARLKAGQQLLVWECRK